MSLRWGEKSGHQNLRLFTFFLSGYRAMACGTCFCLIFGYAGTFLVARASRPCFRSDNSPPRFVVWASSPCDPRTGGTPLPRNRESTENRMRVVTLGEVMLRLAPEEFLRVTQVLP